MIGLRIDIAHTKSVLPSLALGKFPQYLARGVFKKIEHSHHQARHEQARLFSRILPDLVRGFWHEDRHLLSDVRIIFPPPTIAFGDNFPMISWCIVRHVGPRSIDLAIKAEGKFSSTFAHSWSRFLHD
ncbi:hypothetical protein N792_03885 [Lysobacter concretionis Ko07 = DSM 16239]|uniref:Uncharacterized protein n=1 Tax=Lysobacter concretionis Ko07 = DSM 16239 TaxID=1122185 RepID=A0A0A0EMQ7_9GAMM|nr:hypothetical protein N792_03885 [Lysobacter concretionis Ko07 = DSM 16239]